MAKSGTAAWMPSRPEQQPPAASGPRFARPSGQRRTTGRSTRPFRFGSEDRPDPDPALTPGELVGERYRIVRLLGEGGMGRVYEAEHTVLQRRVALKLLRRSAQEQPENLARFQQEALAASRIGTPQIVEIVDFASHTGPAGQQTYMVMELLGGESLEQWMAAGEGASLDVGVELLAQLSDGLAAAHRAGVIHRDIKPANVFCQPPDPTRLGSSGEAAPRVKILDFGIAKITDGGHGPQTQQGSLLGTPYYLAPERVMGEPLTAAADLYSVGVILYEMLTGNVPFTADSFMGILARHVHGEPLDPRQAAPDRNIPDEIASACMRLLAKRPEARPSAEALALDLRSMLARDRAALAAVAVGPRELTTGPESDTQVFDDVDADGLSERPTLPPTESVAQASVVEARPRSSTAVGHASVASAAATAAIVRAPEASPAPEPRSRAGLVAGVITVVVGGVIAIAGFTIRAQQRSEAAVEVAPPPATPPSEPAAEPEPVPVPAIEPATAPATIEPTAEPTTEPVAEAPPEDRPADEAKPRKRERKSEPTEAKPEPEPEPPAREPDPPPSEPPPPSKVDPNLPTIKDDVYD